MAGPGSFPLSGVRVLEIGGGPPAAFATRLLAGYGADVVRSEGAPGALTPDEEVYLLAGKRRVQASGDALRDLALAADILIEDHPPGALAGMGLVPERLRRRKPSLVGVSITPFGQQGPYAAYEAPNIVSFALGGIMSLTGHPSRPPLVSGGSQAQALGGLNAFGAALTAYYGALVHGEGDWLDISLQECAAGMLELYGAMSESAKTGPVMRSGNQIRAVWGIYPCADGYAGVCCLERQVKSFFALLNDPELEEPRFADILQRAEHDDELQAKVFAWFLERTKAEILELGPKHRVPFGVVTTPADLLANNSLAERGYFDTVATPQGEARVPGRPFLGLPWRPAELRPPAADTAAVLDEWLAVRT
ncbi:MAG: CaiB/BaiF CoA transferase family protein [Tepidiformaceae bacterium]